MPLRRAISCKQRHGATTNHHGTTRFRFADRGLRCESGKTVGQSHGRPHAGRVCVACAHAAGLHAGKRPTASEEDRTAATGNVRGLLGRSRRPPIRGHTSSVPPHGLRGVGGLKQLPKPVCQQFDGLPQGTELPNPD